MNPETIKQWLIKAEHDYKIGKGESATDQPATDMICFHMQQCVEKYLKAFLLLHDKEIKKTHDIAVILNDCIAIDPAFQELIDKGIDNLSPYSVTIRYPDDFHQPTLAEMQEAIALTEITRRFIANKFQVTEQVFS